MQWAGGRNRWVDFKGEKRSRDTHESKTDKDALLYKKSPGTGAKLCYLGHLLMENRHGLVVDAQVTQATGIAEREAGGEGGLLALLAGLQVIVELARRIHLALPECDSPGEYGPYALQHPRRDLPGTTVLDGLD